MSATSARTVPSDECGSNFGRAVRGGPLPAEDVVAFHRDGYVVVRNVLKAAEVSELRGHIESFASQAKARGHVLRSQTGEIVPVADLLGQPGVGWLVSDPRIVGIARQLVGRNELVYFGDSGTMVGGQLRGFHKDNTVRDRPEHDDWQSPYTIIRIGFYLQDHERHSGGLKIRRSSHLHVDVTSGKIVAVPTRPGDIVAWSLRTTHSGFAVRLRLLPGLPLQPRIEQRLPNWIRAPQERTRVAAFLTFGTNDHHLRNYVDKHADLTSYPENYLYKQWLYSDGSDAASRGLAKAGVKLLRPVAEYGSLCGSTEVVPEGFVRTLPPRPDVYEARGLESWIQAAGRVLRSLRSSS